MNVNFEVNVKCLRLQAFFISLHFDDEAPSTTVIENDGEEVRNNDTCSKRTITHEHQYTQAHEG